MENFKFESPESLDSKVVSHRGFEFPDKIDGKSGLLAFGTEAFLRPKNEDRIFVDIERDAFAVIDGLGGYEGGERAAELVAECLQYGLEENLDPHEMQKNMWLCMKGENIITGGAAYVAAKVEKKVLKIWSAGDAGIFVVDSKGNIKFKNSNRDLSDAPRGKYEGKTTIEYADLMNYDRILLATDGLIDNANLEEVLKHVKDLPVERGIQEMAVLAKQGMLGSSGNRDNLSIIYYEILPVPLRKVD